MGTIVAALSILAGGALVTLAGCGQRGPLYLPTVPPLPSGPPPSSSAPKSGDETRSSQSFQSRPDGVAKPGAGEYAVVRFRRDG